MSVAASFQFCAAAWELHERLIYHSQTGRMLAGLEYDYEGTKNLNGESRLPIIQPFSFGLEESISPGAPKATAGTKNAVVLPEQRLTFTAAFSRRDSYFRRNPADATKPKGAMEWIGLILDAVEKTRADTPVVDTGLANTTIRPSTLSVEPEETTEMAFHFLLTFTLYPKHHCRGERASLFSTRTE